MRNKLRNYDLYAKQLGVLVVLALALLCTMPAIAKDKKEKEGGTAASAPIFYPEEPAQPRIQFLRAIHKPSDVEPKVGGFKAFVLGKDDKEDLPIIKPYGVTVNAGRIFVCDSMAGQVSVFDVKGKRYGVIGKGAPKGALQKPVNITVDKDGTCYVSDVGLKRVLVYAPDFSYRTAFGEPDKIKPVDTAILDNELYVVDGENAQILVLNKTDGKEIRRFGSKGSKEGEFFLPSNIAIDPDGNIYVSDTGNTRVEKFDNHGKFVRQFGAVGDQPGTFTRPKGIALDKKRRLYAVDAAFENVQLFDPEGKLLLYFGTSGVMPGNLCMPAKIAVDYDNVDLFKEYVAPGYEIEYLILITNQYGDPGVNVYGFLKDPKQAQ